MDTWWLQWQRDAFQMFCPRRTWKTTHRNIEIGDIVLLKYDKHLGKDKYRLAKVLEVHPDNHGHVRTVTIGIRDLRKARSEQPQQATAPQTQMTVAVQRLVVLLPVNETWPGGLANNQ